MNRIRSAPRSQTLNMTINVDNYLSKALMTWVRNPSPPQKHIYGLTINRIQIPIDVLCRICALSLIG